MSKRKITDSYGAWWFIYHHPHFLLRERIEITPEQATEMEQKGFIITRDRSGKCYWEMRHLYRHALDSLLSIHYTQVNDKGHKDDDTDKNQFVRCWLEFGTESYGYFSDEFPNTGIITVHDTELDCGAASFDEALVTLANNILKKYGDYTKAEGKQGECGKPICGDCSEERVWLRAPK